VVPARPAGRPRRIRQWLNRGEIRARYSAGLAAETLLEAAGEERRGAVGFSAGGDDLNVFNEKP
jgi:hypothetical protein